MNEQNLDFGHVAESLRVFHSNSAFHPQSLLSENEYQPKVKICGIQTKEEAEWAVQYGVDMLGFVFAKSKRQVSLEQAKKIAKGLPPSIKKVGVFVNPELDEVLNCKEQVPLDLIQFHGNESPEFVKQLSPSIKAIQVRDGKFSQDIWTYPDSLILLDAPEENFVGGNGKSFDWEKLLEVKLPKERLIVAGGLNEKNVLRAIGLFKPFAVDVSSSVETMGKKDQTKIKNFIQQVKGVRENGLSSTR
ncbi:N-(5'-phosphoribosyl)anthranilate isomerase [Clostridia bacterium]|nr:N-(5'-phosphoribosyl)anthranilate isomerase [Clostridia bacterium]